MRPASVFRVMIVAIAAAIVACGEPPTSTSITGAAAGSGKSGSTPVGASGHAPIAHGGSHGDGTGSDPSSGANLLVCPVDTSVSVHTIIGSLGGALSIGGTSVAIPAGALLGDTTVTLTLPAGQLMEADLSVGAGQSIVFLKPVVVTIDYSRCGRAEQTALPLSVWNIDEHTKALLENMGGLDNKLTQQLTFTTIHFSGYAVAN